MKQLLDKLSLIFVKMLVTVLQFRLDFKQNFVLDLVRCEFPVIKKYMCYTCGKEFLHSISFLGIA